MKYTTAAVFASALLMLGAAGAECLKLPEVVSIRGQGANSTILRCGGDQGLIFYDDGNRARQDTNTRVESDFRTLYAILVNRAPDGKNPDGTPEGAPWRYMLTQGLSLYDACHVAADVSPEPIKVWGSKEKAMERCELLNPPVSAPGRAKVSIDGIAMWGQDFSSVGDGRDTLTLDTGKMSPAIITIRHPRDVTIIPSQR